MWKRSARMHCPSSAACRECGDWVWRTLVLHGDEAWIRALTQLPKRARIQEYSSRKASRHLSVEKPEVGRVGSSITKAAEPTLPGIAGPPRQERGWRAWAFAKSTEWGSTWWTVFFAMRPSRENCSPAACVEIGAIRDVATVSRPSRPLQ